LISYLSSSRSYPAGADWRRILAVVRMSWAPQIRMLIAMKILTNGLMKKNPVNRIIMAVIMTPIDEKVSPIKWRKSP
jgi:hypothetical protein